MTELDCSPTSEEEANIIAQLEADPEYQKWLKQVSELQEAFDDLPF